MRVLYDDAMLDRPACAPTLWIYKEKKFLE